MSELLEEGQTLKNLKTLSYKLPNEKSSILNVYFTNHFLTKKQYIQILALNTEKNILIMATWDITDDYEFSMF